ncbi:hypothetical protein QHH03_28320, partial [Aphanizomenon sp. 202]|nr:hypothetical protein [Aphanizomenon sp. 202]
FVFFFFVFFFFFCVVPVSYFGFDVFGFFFYFPLFCITITQLVQAQQQGLLLGEAHSFPSYSQSGVQWAESPPWAQQC